MKINRLVLTIFLLGLLLRLMLIPFGNHGDILSLANWGKWIYFNGPQGFYEHKVWTYASPTQLPFFNFLMAFAYIGYYQTLELMRWLTFNIVPHLAPGHMLWWFDWVKWWESMLVPASLFFPLTDLHYGFIMWIKILPITADLILAMIIYNFGKKHLSISKALLLSSLFLFLPFSWYLSSFWGQYDQVATLLLIGSFFLLSKRYFLFSAIFSFLAIQIKPTSGFFLPFYVFYFLRQKPNLRNIITSSLGIGAVFWLTTMPFSTRNTFEYTFHVILSRVLNDRWLLANHAFNFWAFLIPQVEKATIPILGLPAFIWASLFLFGFNVWSIILVIRRNDLKHLLIGLYLVGGGSYLFYIGQLDRYFFPVVFILGLLNFYFPKLLKLWIITCMLYSINLFYSWGFPFLPNNQNWQDLNIIRIFSLAQVVVFFACLHRMRLLQYKRIPFLNKKT